MFKKGYKPTIEHRKKLSLAKIGRPSWSKGKKFSDEHRKKLSVARKSYKQSIETIMKGVATRTAMGIKPPVHVGEKNNKWKGGISKIKGYGNIYKARHELRKLGADGFHTVGEWDNLKVQYNFVCPNCKKQEPNIKLEKDHIIPISKGGSNNIENIQPLCRGCNARKNTKIIKYELD